MTKIDYEITVDVSGADIETKKRVQDAFFKLGISWGSGDKYACLNRQCYTNTFSTGKVTQVLMWSGTVTKPTHTIEELMELADMETKTDLKPFSLEKALAGEPVVTRGGHKAYIRHHETLLESKYPLFGYILRGRDDNEMITWTVDGAFNTDAVEGSLDIVGMWKEPYEFYRWDLLLPSIVCIAKDLSGVWYGYEGIPVKDLQYAEWDLIQSDRNLVVYRLEGINPSLFPNCVWKESLIKRPEK